MGDEQSGAKYERLKAVQGGHQGITTRVIKEADELTSARSEESQSRLDVIHKQLELKHIVLSGLDTQSVLLCNICSIEEGLQDAEGVTARILECKEKSFKSSNAMLTSAVVIEQPGGCSSWENPFTKVSVVHDS